MKQSVAEWPYGYLVAKHGAYRAAFSQVFSLTKLDRKREELPSLGGGMCVCGGGEETPTPLQISPSMSLKMNVLWCCNLKREQSSPV